MKDQHKTKQQLVAELTELRQRITKLEAVETEREQAEESLRASEQNFRDLVENLLNGVAIADENFHHIYVNPKFAEITGYSVDELLNMSGMDFTRPEDVDKFQQRMKKRMAGEPHPGRYERVMIRKDGTEVIVEMSTTTTTWQGKKRPMAIIHDVTAHKKTEEALEESEEKYRLLADNSIDVIWQMDLKLVFTYVSPSVKDVMGYTVEEWIGSRLSQHASTKDFFNMARKALYAIKNYKTLKHLTFDALMLRKDGTEIPVEIVSKLLFNKKGLPIGLQGTTHDITERKRAAEALKKRTEEIELLYQAGRQISQTLDTDTIYSRLHNFLSGIMDCDSLAVSSFDPENGLIHCAFAVIEGNQQKVAKFPPLPLNPQSRGTQSVTIRTGKSLLIKDYQDWIKTSERAYYVNEGGKVVEYDKSPADADVARSALIVPMKLEGQVVGVIQVMSYRPDAYTENDLRILESLASQIAVAGNNALLYQQAQDEITQRKQAEEELRKHRDHLEEMVAERTAELDRRVAEVEQLNRGMTNLLEDLQAANRHVTRTARRLEQSNIELESFTYSVSHDLRAPLRHMDSFAKLLLEREAAQLEPTSARYLQNIVAATDKMRQLIDDLLALSRTGRAEMRLRPVASNKIVEKAWQDLAPTLAGRRITWEIAPLPTVQADPGLLRVVWDNLLSNAVKYTGPRPETRIEIGATPPDEQGRVTFFIRDNGVGFDPQYTHKLFGTFQRLHRAEEFEGSGIGLATVRRIIHRHGGRVWAEGELDRGATFYFTLSALID